jgi:hypothetical protein
MFNIWVFGYESYENKGGWGLYYKTSNKRVATIILQSVLTIYDEEDVDWDFVI